MAYTAAGISFLIQNSEKPIILTGAQKPVSSDSTDSKTNLTDAILCALSDLAGVFIVFDHKIILGTRAKKTHTKSFQAFSSINYPYIGVLRDQVLMQYIASRPQQSPTFYNTLDTKVALMKLIPGNQAEQMAFLLERNDALIIESYGVGGLPEANCLFNCIQAALVNGKTIVLTTQVPYDGSDLGIYSVGYHLKNDLGVLEAYDMTTEAVVAKMMWILGQTKDPREIRQLFYRPVAHEILYTDKQQVEF